MYISGVDQSLGNANINAMGSNYKSVERLYGLTVKKRENSFKSMSKRSQINNDDMSEIEIRNEAIFDPYVNQRP